MYLLYHVILNNYVADDCRCHLCMDRKRVLGSSEEDADIYTSSQDINRDFESGFGVEYGECLNLRCTYQRNVYQ